MNLIVFDFDGTIADSFEIFIEATNCLAEDFGYPSLSSSQISRFRSLSLKVMVQELGIPKWKLPFFLRRFRKELNRQMSDLQLVNGMKEALLELDKKDYRFGIVTSNSHRNVENFLYTQELNHLFGFIYGGQVLSGKAGTLKRIARRARVEPQKVIFIGDEVGDVEAAKRARLSSIAVSWGFNDKQILEQYSPDVLVNHPQQLVSVIVQLCNVIHAS